MALSVLQYGCSTSILRKLTDEKVVENYIRIQYSVLASVSLFHGISTFVGYLISDKKNSRDTI